MPPTDSAPATADTRDASDAASPTVCVLAPTPQLSIEIEPGRVSPDAPELHVHHGGQGLWVARMAHSLGAEVVVCGPFGGETGTVAAFLAESDGLRVRRTLGTAGAGGYVHDRRDGEREEVATAVPHPLDRHEVDDLYGTVLVEGLEADVVVLTGADPATTIPADLVGRLAADLRAAGRPVVADLSGDAARAFAAAGGSVLKMSHEELVEAGIATGEGAAALLKGARSLLGNGLEAVVVSRADEPALVVTASDVLTASGPELSVVDHRGAGDSMTAGLAVGLARGLDLEGAVRLGVAAGALNVTRHGLGTGRREHVERVAEEVSLEPHRAAARTSR